MDIVDRINAEILHTVEIDMLHYDAIIEIQRLRAELAECKRDAERYRAVRYAIAHNIDPDYQGVMNDEIPVSEQMEDLDKVVDWLKVKVDAALAVKEKQNV